MNECSENLIDETNVDHELKYTRPVGRFVSLILERRVVLEIAQVLQQ